ncbi:TetR/AcrR family transcriptional regulator [Gordonia sp. (in: high G+C Gram-positive bacteria)]|jgi:AcrR family transcriptional regulator|uniref:TetR/AcrR family transcriptional regulator n=1 Tax=Gordonia sp. (in: high G+C Gram-positive bacteria) TaxID=84139 RepID=UPI00263092C5|nr:TetR/AcrR family transcriptional regulator [Gordonia sp. (in: high G+C Gram-positive bacteria)]HMS76557.1 TetR/AcrR family transcriptional regulator [Gordonia sp. (in: high G+C Gram-positive bacteria)]HQV17584.1 TetR/AcrR family transcriptional regulator [Gordonia sp. (in: high G+C Gram-positive bacteria)]
MVRRRSPRGSGDRLAGEIVDAAIELLIDAGDDSAVSIRSVAARVGVTPPSIYLHFADKQELLDAVWSRYFENIDGVLAAACEGVEDPLERLVRMGVAYVRFAVGAPALYRLLDARTPRKDHSPKGDELTASAPFVRLHEAVSELVGSDPDAGVLEFWAAAHGIASLMICRPDLGWDDDLGHAEHMFTALCRGMGGRGMSRSSGRRITRDGQE